jgi:hypothetical protein
MIVDASRPIKHKPFHYTLFAPSVDRSVCQECPATCVAPYRFRLARTVQTSIDAAARNPFLIANPLAQGDALVRWILAVCQHNGSESIGFSSLLESLRALTAHVVIGQGATSIVSAPAVNTHTLEQWLNDAWDSLSPADFAAACQPVACAPPLKQTTSLRRITPSQSSQWPIVVKLAKCPTVIVASTPLAAIDWSSDFCWNTDRVAHQHPLLEPMVYALVSHHLAPLLPNVSQFGACFPARDPSDAQSNAFVQVKCEELLSGVSLSRLFRNPDWTRVRDALSCQDIAGMIGQSIVVSLVQQ